MSETRFDSANAARLSMSQWRPVTYKLFKFHVYAPSRNAIRRLSTNTYRFTFFYFLWTVSKNERNRSGAAAYIDATPYSDNENKIKQKKKKKYYIKIR